MRTCHSGGTKSVVFGRLDDGEAVDLVAGPQLAHLPDVGASASGPSGRPGAFPSRRPWAARASLERVTHELRLHRVHLGDHAHLGDMVGGVRRARGQGEHLGEDLLVARQQIRRHPPASPGARPATPPRRPRAGRSSACRRSARSEIWSRRKPSLCQLLEQLASRGVSQAARRSHPPLTWSPPRRRRTASIAETLLCRRWA